MPIRAIRPVFALLNFLVLSFGLFVEVAVSTFAARLSVVFVGNRS